jgi:hypothetical protein
LDEIHPRNKVPHLGHLDSQRPPGERLYPQLEAALAERGLGETRQMLELLENTLERHHLVNVPETMIPDSRGLVALTLLIAASAPDQKELLIRLVINLLQESS